MFQQQDNSQSQWSIVNEQRENDGKNHASVQVMGMGWQPNGNQYGNVTMSLNMPSNVATSSYEFQPNWMATSFPGSSGIQNPSSPDQPTSPNQLSPNYSVSSPTTSYSSCSLSQSSPRFDQPGPSNRPSFSNHDHQAFNDGLFKTPDSSVFAIKRERSHSAPNSENYHAPNVQEANTSSRRTLNNSRLSRRIQPYAHEDLLRINEQEQARKQKNNERERRRVQILNQAYDQVKEVMTKFPGPNPKTKLETLEAPVRTLGLFEYYLDNLLFPEEFAIFQNMDPKEPLEQQPSTSNE